MVEKFDSHNKQTKLLDVCKIRWVHRIEGLERFMTMYKATTETMFAIRETADGSWDACDANPNLHSSLLTSFHFIVTLVVVRMVLSYARSATSQLQGHHIDIIKSLQEISTIIFSLQTARNDIGVYHNGCFREIVNTADSAGAIVFSPRLCNRQVHRNKIAADNVSTYFRKKRLYHL